MSEGKTGGRRIKASDSQIMPPVTIRIPMPKGASTPAQPTPAGPSNGKK
jgi:hypothetical protein